MKHPINLISHLVLILLMTFGISLPAAATTVHRQHDMYGQEHSEFDYGETSHRAGIGEWIPGQSLRHADNGVVYQDVRMISDRSFFTEMFYIDTAGTYEATLTDLVFPSPFRKLGMSVATPMQQLGTTLGMGSFLFDAEPGDYYLSLFAKTDSRYRLGQYGVNIALINEASPVPLPPAVLLFASGLLALTRIPARRSHEKG